jgi:hypothetical protein
VSHKDTLLIRVPGVQVGPQAGGVRDVRAVTSMKY